MARRIINQIRDAIRNGTYDLTYHSVEEMAEDGLEIFDVENAVKNGKIIRREKDDPRGNKYTIEGMGIDGSTPIRVVGRFKETGSFLILTVYKQT